MNATKLPKNWTPEQKLCRTIQLDMLRLFESYSLTIEQMDFVLRDYLENIKEFRE